MSRKEEQITVVVECTENGGKRRVTVAELGVALTVANRIVNRLLVSPDMYSRFDSTRSEPDFIALEIHEVRSGSVVLQTAIDLSQSPFVQSVAGGVLANAITPHAKEAVKSVVGQLRRLGHVGYGKGVELTIRVRDRMIKVSTEYRSHGKSTTRVEIDPPQDTQ